MWVIVLTMLVIVAAAVVLVAMVASTRADAEQESGGHPLKQRAVLATIRLAERAGIRPDREPSRPGDSQPQS